MNKKRLVQPIVHLATEADTPSWLMLAAEVEPLFGPMVDDPGFLRALSNNIARGSAFCIRDEDRDPGAALLGGLLWSASGAPIYGIGWLAVAERARRRGIGSALIKYALQCVVPPAQVVVTTFGEDVAGGEAARHLYQRLGFMPAEAAPNGPEGSSRQVYQLTVAASP